MKKALFALPIALFTAVTLASCGTNDTKEETVGFDDANPTSGMTEIDSMNAQYFQNYYLHYLQDNSQIRLEDKNVTSVLHEEKNEDGVKLTWDYKEVYNFLTNDYTFMESYTSSSDSAPDTPYSVNIEVTGLYQGEGTWNCYLDYDIKNFKTKGESEKVYNSMLEDYEEIPTYQYVSKSGRFYSKAINENFSTAYHFYGMSTINFLSDCKYYMNMEGNLLITGKNDTDDLSYLYYENGILTRKKDVKSTETSDYTLTISEPLEIQKSDKESYTKEITVESLKYIPYSLMDLQSYASTIMTNA